MDIPDKVFQWNVTSYDGEKGFGALESSERPISPLGDSEVLVKLHAASINFRDLVIPLGKYPFALRPNIVPGSDGAGTVIAVGKQVTRFTKGDQVITLFNQAHIGGPLNAQISATGLGGAIDGTFRTVGAFKEDGLVHMPPGLSPTEASTFTCAGLTAWNALFGSADHKLIAGQWVLTEGTGGVSLFAVQFAKAAGAKVIATTSSTEKAALLKRLGADHIINYNENPDWGVTAKKLTSEGGVDHVVEVIGPKTMAQSLKAIKIGGQISIIGFVGGSSDEQPGFLDCLTNQCTARGLMVGSRVQMEDMLRAVEANLDKLRPVVDPRVFSLQELKEAYEYQLSGKHQGNVCVRIP